MKLALSLLLAFLIPAHAWAFACNAQNDGNASEPSTWTGCNGGIPGDGDTITVGDYDVVIDEDMTVGDGSANAINQTHGNGSITQAGGTTLTVKGGVRVVGTWIGNPGFTLLFYDTGGSINYFQFDPPWEGSGYIQFGADGNSTRSAIGLHVSDTDGVYFVQDTGVGMPQDWRFYSVDVSGVGDGSNRMFFPWTLNGAFRDRLTVVNSTFDDCGYISGSLDANGTLDIRNSTFTNARAATSVYLIGSEDYASGTRRFTGNALTDSNVDIRNPDTFTIENNILAGGLVTIWTEAEKPSSWARNFVVHSGDNVNINADMSEDYWLITNTGKTNPHGPNVMTQAVGSLTMDGNIAESLATDKQGEFFLLGSPASGTNTLTLQNNILLKNSSGSSWGALVTGLGNSNVSLIANNNGGFVRNGTLSTDREFIRIGETSYLASLVAKSNLVYSDESSAAVHIARDQTGSTSVAAATDIDYNVGWNTADAGEFATKYSNFSGSPAFGANDVAADPQFVDSSVNIAAWDASLGGPGTAANAITELAKKNLSTFNSAYTFAALRAFIEAGLTPQNAALQGTSHDGGDIGPLPVVVPSGGGGGMTVLFN